MRMYRDIFLLCIAIYVKSLGVFARDNFGSRQRRDNQIRQSVRGHKFRVIIVAPDIDTCHVLR